MSNEYEQVKKATIKTGSMEGSKSASFDVKLFKPNLVVAQARKPWWLWITLNVNLKQRNPNPWPVTIDSNGTAFLIEPWKPNEWDAFKRGAEGQARLWDRKFFLKPPPTFTDGDIMHGGGRASTWRPYIDCIFSIRFSPSAPHTTVEAVKLNIDYEKSQRIGFRPNAMLWDSLDLTPRASIYEDISGRWSDYSQPAVAHEIGHALGLLHIGVLRRAPLCTIARTFVFNPSNGGNFVGGRDADVCYGGWYVDGTLSEDIMGGGGTFSEADGLPWVWAMQQLRNRNDERWEVLLQEKVSETGSFVLKGT